MNPSDHLSLHQPIRSTRQKVLAMLGLCFVLIMVALDQTVIGTAMPTIVADLHGFDLYAWVGTAYLLTSVITVPIFGKLGDDHGRKPFVTAAIVLFTLASMLCGAAQSMAQLVGARALQGVGGGMLVATTFACIPDMFPQAKERLRWQIMFSSSFGLANAFGPSLGGFLAEFWGWRWVFFVNLPVGIASLVFVWRFLPRIRHTVGEPSRLDWRGAVLLGLTLGCLQLAMEWWPQHKPLALVGALALVGVLSGMVLVWWERRCDNPLLPLSMFTHPSLGPMLALSLLMGFGMFGVVYYAPLMLQGGFGLSPNAAGLLITPLAVSITVGSILNGRIASRIPSPNVMLYVGLSLFCVAALGLTQIISTTPHALVITAMVMGGLGLGTLLPNLTLFVQASAPRVQLGVATAMLQSMRMVGGMLGTALIGTMVSHQYTRGIDELLQARQAQRWARWLADPQVLVDPALATRFRSITAQAGLQADALLPGAREALVDAVHHSQWLVVVLMAVGWFLASRIPPINLHQATGTPAPAHE
jgi:EmrB/QacA subfamily drug resistance transporter